MNRYRNYRIECTNGNTTTMVQYRVTRDAATTLWEQLRAERPTENIHIRPIPEPMPWVRPAGR